MKKEYQLAFIGGLFLLTYALEAFIDPLTIPIASPYDYLQPQYLSRFPFTSAIIFIRSLAVFLTPLFLLSFLPKAWIPKGVALIILAALLQLYSLQNILNAAADVPLEWALSLALAGLALLIPAVLFLLRGFFSSMHTSLVKSIQAPSPTGGPAADAPPEWLSKH